MKDSPPVWMIIPTYHPIVGGAERQAQLLAGGLTARGWTVDVLTRRSGRGWPAGLAQSEGDGLTPVHRVSSPGPGKIGSAAFLVSGLLQILRTKTPAVYHAHDIGTAGLIAGIAKMICGGKSVVKMRTGADVYRRRWDSPLTRWLWRAMLGVHDAIVVVNGELEDLLKEYGIDTGRIARIPNGIDVSRFEPVCAPGKVQARRSLGLPLERTLVLYTGRLNHVKGVDILLEAWGRTPIRVNGGALLVIVGDGPEKEKLKAMAVANRIVDKVVFIGEKQDILGFYQACDVFVLPSRTEGLSNSLLEAMSCGLPVIASRVGGAKDMVSAPEGGLLFPPEDSVSLADCLARYLEDPTAREVAGAAGRSRVRTEAALEEVVSRYERLYGSLLSGGEGP
jgi:glycosyltransferase involved in cell wall biosynthesis